MSQLEELSVPFPRALVRSKPGQAGASYVEHNAVTERLLLHLGAFSWELVELIRSDYPGKKDGEIVPNCVTGAIWRLRCVVDDEEVVIEEVGDVEHPLNWKTDGQRAKDAASDAIKRCAMRLGLGLHLWSGDAYFLRNKLKERAEAEASFVPGTAEEKNE